jgi:hypothetical protein
MSEYVVVRRWQTQKRAYQVAVGPFPTRHQAQRKIEEYIREWGYWDNRDQFSVALYRHPEGSERLGEVV